MTDPVPVSTTIPLLELIELCRPTRVLRSVLLSWQVTGRAMLVIGHAPDEVVVDLGQIERLTEESAGPGGHLEGAHLLVFDAALAHQLLQNRRHRPPEPPPLGSRP